MSSLVHSTPFDSDEENEEVPETQRGTSFTALDPKSFHHSLVVGIIQDSEEDEILIEDETEKPSVDSPSNKLDEDFNNESVDSFSEPHKSFASTISLDFPADERVTRPSRKALGGATSEMRLS